MLLLLKVAPWTEKPKGDIKAIERSGRLEQAEKSS
jgi:hypothetical protein